jgi:hypothetical protein
MAAVLEVSGKTQYDAFGAVGLKMRSEAIRLAGGHFQFFCLDLDYVPPEDAVSALDLSTVTTSSGGRSTSDKRFKHGVNPARLAILTDD